MRLNERHFRILGVIASYDRFGKNGQGCYVNRDRLAQESRLNKTVASEAISDLRRWGYLVSERHPLNRSTLIDRVIYDGANETQTSANNRSSIGNLSDENTSSMDDPLAANRSSKSAKQVAPKNVLIDRASALVPIYIKRQQRYRRAKSGRERRYSAEARTTETGYGECGDG